MITRFSQPDIHAGTKFVHSSAEDPKTNRPSKDEHGLTLPVGPCKAITLSHSCKYRCGNTEVSVRSSVCIASSSSVLCMHRVFAKLSPFAIPVKAAAPQKAPSRRTTRMGVSGFLACHRNPQLTSLDTHVLR